MSRSSDHGCGRVLWEKCANLYGVYKLIMVSCVPGYGHIEYLVFELLIDLITLLNEFVGLLILFWD